MKLLLTATLMLFSIFAIAQNDNENSKPSQGTQSFFAEVGGPGILFSANYDSRFNKTPFGLGGRVGLGFITGDGITKAGSVNFKTESILTVPIQLNYLFGKANSINALEIGAGITVTGKKLNIFEYNDENKYSSVYGTASFMYRRMPKNGGFSLRAGFTPIITSGYIQPSAGISVGYNF